MLHTRRNPLFHTATRTSVAVLCLLTVGAMICAAQTESVVYSFAGGQDGQLPYSNLTLDAKGNLYGTTSGGGTSGGGTVFKIDPTDHESVLYSFVPGDSNGPYAGVLLLSNGNLLGTISCVGTCNNGAASGGVFELASGVESVLAQADGKVYGNLLRDPQGDLYGTSYGALSFSACGTVFEINAAGQYNVLYSFTGPDGCNPYAGLIRDGQGNLYGTTITGGASTYCFGGCGTIFEITASGTEKVLYSFCSLAKCTDGEAPYGRLLRDSAGNLYGTTYNAGSTKCAGHLGGGCGTVFKLTPAGKLVVLHRFASSPNDGEQSYAGLVSDSAGNLYGTTTRGGSSGWGVVFSLTPSGKETILYNFTGGSDGALPSAALIRDGSGNLYSTTTIGGTVNSNCTAGCGVVFKVTP